MKITKISISNFLKLKDIEINPTKTSVIVGKNRQGKTSILKAIRAAFDGKIDESSIRIGEEKAEIMIELDDFNIKRVITEKGNKLDVANKEGFKVPSPQKFLDNLIGNFSFNPIEFFELKPVERKKYLLNAIKITITQDELAEFTGEKLGGLDYDVHALDVVEDARKYYYEQRTVANAEKSKKEKALADLNASIPEGFDPSTVSEEHITKLREAIRTDEQERLKEEAHANSIVALQKQETDIKTEIERLTEKLKGVQDEIIKAVEVKFDVSDDVTIQAAKDTLEKLEGQRQILFTVKRAEEVRGELSEAVKAAERLDEIVKRLSKEVPEALVAKAKLPIAGLTISGDDILINGVTIDNLSSSEQLRFGLEVVRALNGAFKVICVDGIESLDGESFQFFLKEIEDDEFQYFVTRVKNAGEVGIEIEDGEIKK